MKTTTLTTSHGIKWEVGSDGGRASFIYMPLLVKIAYRHDLRRYVVTQLSNRVMSDASAAVCLDKMNEVILDRHAADIVPSFMYEREADLDMAAE